MQTYASPWGKANKANCFLFQILYKPRPEPPPSCLHTDTPPPVFSPSDTHSLTESVITWRRGFHHLLFALICCLQEDLWRTKCGESESSKRYLKRNNQHSAALDQKHNSVFSREPPAYLNRQRDHQILCFICISVGRKSFVCLLDSQLTGDIICTHSVSRFICAPRSTRFEKGFKEEEDRWGKGETKNRKLNFISYKSNKWNDSDRDCCVSSTLVPISRWNR